MGLYIDGPTTECYSWIRKSIAEVLKTVQSSEQWSKNVVLQQHQGSNVVPSVRSSKLNNRASSYTAGMTWFTVVSLFFSEILSKVSIDDSLPFPPINVSDDTAASFEWLKSLCTALAKNISVSDDFKYYFSHIFVYVSNLSSSYSSEVFFAEHPKFRETGLDFFSSLVDSLKKCSDDCECVPSFLSLASAFNTTLTPLSYSDLGIDSAGLLSFDKNWSMNVSTLSTFWPISLRSAYQMLLNGDKSLSRATSKQNTTYIIRLVEHLRVCSHVEPTMIVSSRGGRNQQSGKGSSHRNSNNQNSSFSTNASTGMNGNSSDMTGFGGSGSGDGSGEDDGQGEDKKPPRSGAGRKRSRRRKTKRSKKKQVTRKIPDPVARVMKDNDKTHKKPVYRQFSTKEGLSIESEQHIYTGSAEPSLHIVRSLSNEGDDYIKMAKLPPAMVAKNQGEGYLVNPALSPPPSPNGVNPVRDKPGPFSYAEAVKKGISKKVPPDGVDTASYCQLLKSVSPHEASDVCLESSETMVVEPVIPCQPSTTETAAAQISPFTIPTIESVCPLSVTKIITRQRSYTGVERGEGSLESGELGTAPQPNLHAAAAVQIVEPVEVSASSDLQHTTLVVGEWEMRVVPSTQSIKESVFPSDLHSRSPSGEQLVCISAPAPLLPSVDGCGSFSAQMEAPCGDNPPGLLENSAMPGPL